MTTKYTPWKNCHTDRPESGYYEFRSTGDDKEVIFIGFYEDRVIEVVTLEGRGVICGYLGYNEWRDIVE